VSGSLRWDKIHKRYVHKNTCLKYVNQCLNIYCTVIITVCTNSRYLDTIVRKGYIKKTRWTPYSRMENVYFPYLFFQ